MFCHKCGTQLAEDVAFCQKCGGKVILVNKDTEEQAITDEEVTATVKGIPDSAKTQPIEKKSGCLATACTGIGITGLLGSLSYGLAVGMSDAKIPIFISLGILGGGLVVGVISDIVIWLIGKLK